MVDSDVTNSAFRLKFRNSCDAFVYQCIFDLKKVKKKFQNFAQKFYKFYVQTYV